jgi:hypothetical protein
MQNERMMLSVERDGVVILLGSRDEPCNLYLTFDEASTLASEISNRLLSTQADDILVTDVVLERSEAQSLLLLIEVVVAIEQETVDQDDDHDQESSSRHLGHKVNWLAEGF